MNEDLSIYAYYKLLLYRGGISLMLHRIFKKSGKKMFSREHELSFLPYVF